MLAGSTARRCFAISTTRRPRGIAKLFGASEAGTGCAMQIPSSMPRLKGFRFCPLPEQPPISEPTSVAW